VSIPPFGRRFLRHRGLSIRCGFGNSAKEDFRARLHRLDESTKLSPWTSGAIYLWGACLQQGNDPKSGYARTWASQTASVTAGVACGATMIASKDTAESPFRIYGPGSNSRTTGVRHNVPVIPHTQLLLRFGRFHWLFLHIGIVDVVF
jgi:hypothetical protein